MTRTSSIVDVSDAGIDEATGMPLLVMELLRGEELGKRLERVHRCAPTEVFSYLHQTALALDQTHRAQIVYRDLKPDNLFLCEQVDGPPLIKVLDFGIAKLVAEGSAQAQATRSLGTPMYMAPEQFRSAAAISPATDIFALGMIAYTLLVGAGYWIEESRASGNIYEFVGAAAGGPREPPSARARRRGVTLPPGFDAWFARTTAPSPADRFPSASAAVQALAYALGLGLPPPGQEPFAPAAIGAAAGLPDPRRDVAAPVWTGPAAVPIGPAATPPALGPPPAATGTPWAAPGTPPAGPVAASTGAGTAMIAGSGVPVHRSPAGSSHTLRGTEIITGPVVPVRPAAVAASSQSVAMPTASRSRSAVVAAVAISAVMLLAGAAALYAYVMLSRSSEPADQVVLPTAPAAAERPAPKAASSVIVSAVETSATGSSPAPAEPQASATSSSAPPGPAAAVTSSGGLSSPATGHPAVTPKKPTGSIHRRD